MSALAPQLGGKQTSGEQAENDANGPTVWTGRVLQAESSERQWLVLRFCIRPLGGADRSWPSWISARVRSQFSNRPSKARWATRSRTRRRDPFSILKIQLPDLAGVYLLLPSGALGLTEAIPSEPPSLARPDGRATMAEKGGGHPFGEPERAHVIPAAVLRRGSYSRCCARTLHAMRASLLARAVASTLWCNR